MAAYHYPNHKSTDWPISNITNSRAGTFRVQNNLSQTRGYLNLLTDFKWHPLGFILAEMFTFFCYEPFSSEISSIHKLVKCFKGCYGAVPAVETMLYKMKSSLWSSNQTLNSYWGSWWQVLWLQNKPNSSASHQHADSWYELQFCKPNFS